MKPIRFPCALSAGLVLIFAGMSAARSALPPLATPAQAPVIHRTSEPVALRRGRDVDLFVEAKGSSALTYQWYTEDRDPFPPYDMWSPISGATQATLRLEIRREQVSFVRHNAYWCLVTDAQQRQTDSQPIIITLYPSQGPLFIAHPLGTFGDVGVPVTLKAQALGPPSVHYQWYRNGVALPHATNTTLRLEGDLVCCPGLSDFFVTAADESGHTNFSNDTSVVFSSFGPAILRDPVSVRVPRGGSVTFSVEAFSASPVSYRWYRNGVFIRSSTEPFLNLDHVQPGDIGDYKVSVSSRSGTVLSAVARLDLVPELPVVDPSQVVTTRAGQPESSGDQAGPSRQSRLLEPDGGVLDSNGAFYFADSGNHRIKKLNAAGEVVVVAGTGQPGMANGIATESTFKNPAAVVIDQHGNLLVADSGNHAIRRISPQGEVSTLIGTGNPQYNSLIVQPQDLALDADGSLLVAHLGSHSIHRLTPDGRLILWAGTGRFGDRDGPRALAEFAEPSALAFDPSGSLYIAERGGHRIRRLDPDGNVSTVAGTGFAGYHDDLALQAFLNQPAGLACDALGQLFIADRGNHAIRRLSTAGILQTVAGTGMAASHDGDAAHASFSSPAGLALAPDGTILVADTGNHTLRRIAQLPPPIIPGAPTVHRSPRTATFGLGDSVVLDVVAAGVGELRYQWFRDGSAVPGATNAQWTLTSIAAPHQTGAYHVTVQNHLGSTTSTSVRVDLRATDPPVIGTLHRSLRVPQYASVILSSAAKGTGPLTFELRRIDPSLGENVFAPIATNEFGIFEYETGPTGVTNTLQFAVLDLLGRRAFSERFEVITIGSEHPSPPLIIGQPSKLRVAAGNSASLALEVRGMEPFTATWFKDGTLIGTTSTPELVLTNVARSAAGQYYAWVTDSLRVTSYSDLMVVEVEIPPHPVILRHPHDLVAAPNEPATFDVVTEGDLPPTFQWYRQGHPVVGATAPDLVIPNVTPGDVGDYWVVVSNRNGAARSRTAFLDLSGQPRIAAPQASVELVAGFPGTSGDKIGTAADARFRSPTGLAISQGDTLIIADTGNHRLKSFSPHGSIQPAAGAGLPGLRDGPAAQSQFQNPVGLAVDSRGDIYIADTFNHAVRKLSVDGQVTTLAGHATSGSDDGPRQFASLDRPLQLAVDSSGTVWFTEGGHHGIRRLSPDGDVVLWAGSKDPGDRDGTRSQARFQRPGGIAVGSAGDLFVAETGGHRIRRIDRDGNVSTLGGSGAPGYQDGGSVLAQFREPTGLALDEQGAILVADTGNHAIRRLSPSGLVETLAGTGSPGSLNGPVATASFSSPAGVAVAPDGSVYVTDTGTHTLRRIAPGMRLTFRRVTSSGLLTLSWTSGVLQSAPTPLGPWTSVPNAPLTYVLSPSAAPQFFRTRSE